FCAIASNAVGIRFGQVLTFTTSAMPPIVTSEPATVLGSDATLNGAANPKGSATTAWFRYSSVDPGACNDSFGTRTDDVQLGDGRTDAPFSQTIANLDAGTYYVCAIAANEAGTAFGEIVTLEVAATGGGGCGCHAGDGGGSLFPLMLVVASICLRR